VRRRPRRRGGHRQRLPVLEPAAHRPRGDPVRAPERIRWRSAERLILIAQEEAVMAVPLGPDATIGVACLGVTHPHTSGRVRAVQRRTDMRMLGAADESPILPVFCDALGLEARSKQEILDDPDVHVVYVHSKSYAMADLSIEALE